MLEGRPGRADYSVGIVKFGNKHCIKWTGLVTWQLESRSWWASLAKFPSCLSWEIDTRDFRGQKDFFLLNALMWTLMSHGENWQAGSTNRKCPCIHPCAWMCAMKFCICSCMYLGIDMLPVIADSAKAKHLATGASRDVTTSPMFVEPLNLSKRNALRDPAFKCDVVQKLHCLGVRWEASGGHPEALQWSEVKFGRARCREGKCWPPKSMSNTPMTSNDQYIAVYTSACKTTNQKLSTLWCVILVYTFTRQNTNIMFVLNAGFKKLL